MKQTKPEKGDVRGGGEGLKVQTLWSGQLLCKAPQQQRPQVFCHLKSILFPTQEEKEELLQYKSTVASLVGRAKTIIQLKPRNPDCPLKTSIPIKAICDYRQIEVLKLLETDQFLALFIKNNNNKNSQDWVWKKRFVNHDLIWLFCSSF